MPMGEGRTAAPTGCFKCGRPGHWSRDCHSSSASKSNSNPNSDSWPNFSTNSFKQPSETKPLAASAKKLPRSRPKLTPDLLLSDDGLGYVLRHFPRAFKYHGPGHEVSDLGNLIGMYAEWHSHLIPYYSFDQFVRKVEQISASRRVKRCIDQLKERVSRGGDPTKLHEDPAELADHDKEPGHGENESLRVEETAHMQDPLVEDNGRDHMQEEMINEIYEMATNVDSSQTQNKSSEDPQAAAAPADMEPPNHSAGSLQTGGGKRIQITEEQRERMEANRIKALERAKQARISQAL